MTPRRYGLLAFAVALTGILTGAHGAALPARALVLQERIQAQRVIDSFYYGHQVGTVGPFELAVPVEVSERKVHLYLKQSIALERFWGFRIRPEALQAELHRIVARSKFPDRLRDLFHAFHDDSVLIQECIVRPVLVERLIRSSYASDDRIHSGARTQAENLREQLLTGEVDPHVGDQRRTVTEIVEVDGIPDAQDTNAKHLQLKKSEFDRVRAAAPARVTEIGPIQEEPEAFVIRVVLDDAGNRARIASFVIAKLPWNRWWRDVERQFDESTFDAIPARPSSLAAVRQTTDPCASNDTWDNGSMTAVPEQRVFHATVWTGTHMLIWGGHDNLTLPVHGLKYDALTDSWERTTEANAPAGRWRPTAVWTGSEMIVWGGNAGPTSFNSGGRYDPATDTWIPTSLMGAPTPRARHTAVWTGQRMLIWGGTDDSGSFDTGGAYDPQTDAWTPTSTLTSPSARLGHTAVWTGSRMIVWGGGDQTGGRYDPLSDSWEATSIDGAPFLWYFNTAVWTGSLMIVWGGLDGVGNIGARYDPASDTWTPVSRTNAPEGRFSHTAVWTGQRMIVWGGEPSPPFFGTIDSGGQYDPETDTWMATSFTNVPLARSGHTAVWTGSRMIVWGGAASFGTFLRATGAQYDPAADLWTPTSSTVNAPTPRIGHTAIWTGNTMIVWGGWDIPEYLNSGGIYDPLIDSWRTTSVLDAPSARVFHTAIWTGSAMLVWGGRSVQFGSLALLADGGRYDPLLDEWKSISHVSAPSARYSHSAVWTGSEMIVWGGKTTTGSLGTGGRYDQVTDRWAPVSASGAPESRSDHTAVWSNSVMIVWGGVGLSGALGSGGVYAPSTDTWRATPTFGAPQPRLGHTAIWTGREMVIWGGGLITAPSAAGARFDPVADVWTAMSLMDAPQARMLHTAVWTGSRMIVWGGMDRGMRWFDTGARYDPLSDSWQPTSTVGAAFARSNHSAVWTGGSMLVWGGVPSIPVRGTGGQYYLFDPPDSDLDGFTICSGDCDDSDPLVNPAATEVCNGQDDDCNGTVPVAEMDRDEDGFAGCRDDCDDLDTTINPLAPDLPGNLVDENCDGSLSCAPDGFWKNHGDFVRCVVRVCRQLTAADSVSAAACDALIVGAARADVGGRQRRRVHPAEVDHRK